MSITNTKLFRKLVPVSGFVKRNFCGINDLPFIDSVDDDGIIKVSIFNDVDNDSEIVKLTFEIQGL